MRTIHREIVGAFIFSADNKILLGMSRRGGVYDGQYVVPGGGVEEGESLMEALKREILEETGMDVGETKIVQSEETSSGESEKTLPKTGERVIVKMEFNDFIVKLPEQSSDIPIIAEDDFVMAEWFDLDELKNLPLAPPTVKTLIKLDYL